MASLASINVKFSADLKQFSTEMQSALREIEKFGTKLQDVGKTMSTYVTLPLLAAGAAAIHFASDYEESLNKVDAAFKGSSDEVKEFAKTSLTSFGIAEGTALDLASTYGDMATSLGLSTGAAAKMSTELVGLAGDLSSFKNIGIEQANTALAGIFTGETESLKKLGVVMTEANLQAFALSQGIKTQVKDMDQASKVNLRYAYILSVTKNAQGDFAKTSGGAANQMRIFQESLKQLAQQFGSIILPVFTEMVNGINGIIASFSSLSTEAKTTIVIVAAIAAAIGPLILAIGTVISLLPTLAAGFAALTGPIGLTVLALAAVATVIVTNWKPIKQILVDTANYFIDLYNSSTVFRIGVEGIILIFKNLWATVKFVFNAIIATGKFVISQLFSGFATLGKLIKAALTFDLSGVKAALASGFSDGGKNAVKFFNSIKDDSLDASAEIGKNINTAVTNAFSKGNMAKITIPKEAVNTDGVAQAVEEAINEGVSGAAGLKKVKPLDNNLKTNGLADLKGAEITTPVKIKTIDPAIAEMTDRLLYLQEVGQQVGAAVSDAFANMAGSFVDSLGLASSGAEGFLGGMLVTATKLISMLLAECIALAIKSASISAAFSGPAAVFTQPAFIATAVGGVVAAFSAIPKFETGGIVGGTSYTGDKILARLNSGELVLNKQQQSNLYGQLNNNAVNVNVGGSFELDGMKLKLILDRANKLSNRIT